MVALVDLLGAVAVHGCCGIWGTWSLGLFATGQFGTPKGVLWGAGEGSVKLLVAQVGGNLIMAACAFAAAMVLMLGVRATKTLRVSEEGEREGIDIHEHGAPAYHPEAAYMGQGMS